MEDQVVAYHYAIRVALSYTDISSVVQEWSKSAPQVIVYEHQGDSSVSRTHCHFLMLNCKYKTPEALKRQFHSRVETSLKGNELWSWKQGNHVDIKFITYMSKGKLRPVFVKNFIPDEVEELRLKWIEPTPKGESLSEKKEATKTKAELLLEMSTLVNESDFEGYGIDYISEYLVKVVLKVLRKNKIVIGRYKIREYRDALFYNKDSLEQMFTKFVNADIRSDY